MPPKNAIRGSKPARDRAPIKDEDIKVNQNNRIITRSLRPRRPAAEAEQIQFDPRAKKSQRKTSKTVEPSLLRRSNRIATRKENQAALTSKPLSGVAPSSSRPAKPTRRLISTKVKHTQARNKSKPQKGRPREHSSAVQSPNSKNLRRSSRRIFSNTLPRQSASKKPDPFPSSKQAEPPESSKRDLIDRKGIAPWLESIDETEPPREPGSIEIVEDTMTPSPLENVRTADASNSQNSPSGGSDTSTKNSNTTRKTNSKLNKQLDDRLKDQFSITAPENEGDRIGGELRATLAQVSNTAIFRAGVEDVVQTAQDFVKQFQNATSDSDIHGILESFHHKLHMLLPDCGSFTMTEKDFDKDLLHCQRDFANEAIFQRTVLTSTIDRWRLDDIFDYTCEEKWRIEDAKVPLPSYRGEAKRLAPVPDLNISFTVQAVRNEPDQYRSVHNELIPYVFPDRNTYRCFPFFFIETKKANETLDRAKLQNMNNAAHALHNILMCMRGADRVQDFFAKVRVFSIVINANYFEARIHRAVMSQKGSKVTFVYRILREKFKYHRDSVSTLVQVILNTYGKGILLPVLQETYQILSDLVADGKKPKESKGEVEQTAWEQSEQLATVQADLMRHILDQLKEIQPSDRKRKARLSQPNGRPTKTSQARAGASVNSSFGQSDRLESTHLGA